MKQTKKMMVLALACIMTGCAGSVGGELVFIPMGTENVKEYVSDIYENIVNKNVNQKVSYSITKEFSITKLVNGETTYDKYIDHFTIDVDFPNEKFHYILKGDQEFPDPNLSCQTVEGFVFRENESQFIYYLREVGGTSTVIEHNPFSKLYDSYEQKARMLGYFEDIIGCKFFSGYSLEFSQQMTNTKLNYFNGTNYPIEEASLEVALNKNGYFHYDVYCCQNYINACDTLSLNGKIDDYLCTYLVYRENQIHYISNNVEDVNKDTIYTSQISDNFNDFVIPEIK